MLGLAILCFAAMTIASARPNVGLMYTLPSMKLSKRLLEIAKYLWIFATRIKTESFVATISSHYCHSIPNWQPFCQESKGFYTHYSPTFEIAQVWLCAWGYPCLQYSFSGDKQEGYLIDFDFGGMANVVKYPTSYKSDLSDGL